MIKVTEEVFLDVVNFVMGSDFAANDIVEFLIENYGDDGATKIASQALEIFKTQRQPDRVEYWTDILNGVQSCN